MHPEIKKFWEDSGYDLDLWEPADHHSWMKGPTWVALNGQDMKLVAEERIQGNVYYFNLEKFSEEEMLRLVRLKAFL